MNLKEQVSQALTEAGAKNVKLRYYAKSPYQARRYKPEFVEQEVWAKTDKTGIAYCITESDWANPDYRQTVIADLSR